MMRMSVQVWSESYASGDLDAVQRTPAIDQEPMPPRIWHSSVKQSGRPRQSAAAMTNRGRSLGMRRNPDF